MEKDLTDEVNLLNKRINDLEKMLSVLMKPFNDIRKTTESYMSLAGLLFDHSDLTPYLILPELKDSISKDIMRVLLERPEYNVSQISDLVKSRRATASWRIICEKLLDLEKKISYKNSNGGSRSLYNLTVEVIKNWTQILGLTKLND